QVLHMFDSFEVERRKRFIQDPEWHRFAQGQTRERRSAALSLGQHPSRHVLATGKTQASQRLADLRRLPAIARERTRHVQILGGCQVILDRIGVSDVDELLREFLLKPPDIVAAPTYFAARRLEQSARDAQKARLAGTVGSSDSEQLATAQL